MTALSEYIRQLLEQGYEENNIRSFLQSQGYDATTIDASFHQAKKDEKKAHHHKREQSTLYQQLYTYIYSMLGQGYQPQQINQTLLEQGFDSKVIIDVFRHINREYYNGSLNLDGLKPKSKLSITPILIIIIIIGALVAGGVFLMPMLQQEDSFVMEDMELNTRERTLSPGTPLPLEIIIESEQQAQEEPFDVSVKVHGENEQFITEMTRTIFVTGSSQKNMDVELPSDIDSGRYTVEATISKEGSVVSDSTRFMIQESQSPENEDTVSEDESDANETSIDDNTDSSTVDKGGEAEPLQQTVSETYSRSDKILFERALEASSREDAVKHCGEIEDRDAGHECLVATARRYDDKTVCEIAESQEDVEECYIDLVLEGRRELCDEVQLPENVQFCKELELLTGSETDQKALE